MQRSLLSETMLLVSRLMWDKEFHDWALKSPPSSTTGRWELMMEACLLVAKQSSHALRQVLERESLENPRAAVYSLCDIAGGDGDTGIGDEQQQKLEWPAARRQRQLERAAAVPVTVEATETGTQLASAGAAGGEKRRRRLPKTAEEPVLWWLQQEAEAEVVVARRGKRE